MKLMNMTCLASAVLLVSTASSLSAQTCSAATTVGKYLLMCEGVSAAAPNTPLVPTKILGTAVSDYEGNITGTATANLGGVVVTQVAKGKQKINADCTGTITNTQTINGQAAPPVSFTFIITEFGDRVDGLTTDGGAVLSCVFKRTTKNLYAADRELSILAAKAAPKAEETKTANPK